MRLRCTFVLTLMATLASAQSTSLQLPKSITAGSTLSIPTEGIGKAVLYIVGPAQALRHDVQLGGKSHSLQASCTMRVITAYFSRHGINTNRRIRRYICPTGFNPQFSGEAFPAPSATCTMESAA